MMGDHDPRLALVWGWKRPRHWVAGEGGAVFTGTGVVNRSDLHRRFQRIAARADAAVAREEAEAVARLRGSGATLRAGRGAALRASIAAAVAARRRGRRLAAP
jgi:hypothetical protein